MVEKHSKNPVYLDYQSSTPCDPRVISEMIPVLENDFGNPHSTDHKHGWDAAKAVANSRRRLADALGAFESEVVFCSGATEANNLAIRGLAHAPMRQCWRVVTSATDHKSILKAAEAAVTSPDDLEIMPVTKDGLVCIENLKEILKRGPAIVALGWVNSELGVIQPIKEIANLCHEMGSVLHVDAAQAVARLNVDFCGSDADTMSVSGHKMYGPKGVGALFVRRALRHRLSPILYGGGQEEGARSGTLSPFLTVGLGAAAELAADEWESDERRIGPLRDALRSAIISADPGSMFNGDPAHQIAGAINVTFSRIESDVLISRVFNAISISKSSACNAGSERGSHVLSALGLNDEEIRRSIRICLGRMTEPRSAKFAAECIKSVLSDYERLTA